MVTVKIETDNAAFEGELFEQEVSRLLLVAAGRIGSGWSDFDLWDTNGNKVGSVVTRKYTKGGKH